MSSEPIPTAAAASAAPLTIRPKGRWAFYPAIAIAGLGALYALATPDQGWSILDRVTTILFFVAFAVLPARLATARVDLLADTLVIRNTWRTHRLPYRDITAISAGNWGVFPYWGVTAHVETDAGADIPVTATSVRYWTRKTRAEYDAFVGLISSRVGKDVGRT